MAQFSIAQVTDRFIEGSYKDLSDIHKAQSLHGIFIEGYPTGLGKTYEACISLLGMAIKHPELLFIFITEQTKNLPIKEMEEVWTKIYKRDPKELWEKYVLPVESSIDSFRHNYDPSMRKDILDLFTEFNISKRVLSEVLRDMELYNKAVEIKSDSEHLRDRADKFRSSEHDFRKAINAILKPLQSPAKRTEKIRNDPRYKWMGKLYPVTFFDQFPIKLMSDKKFMYPIDNLVSANFTIWSETDLRHDKETGEESSRLSEHIIVIDEFDTFKNVIKDTLIEERKNQVDAVRAFRNLYLRLPGWSHLPELMIKEGPWWANNRNETIRSRFENIIDRTVEIRNRYHMEYLFKQYGVKPNGEYTDPPSASFMFQDYEPYSIGTAFTIKTDESERYNVILSNQNITSTRSRISSLFKELNSLFNMVCRLVRDLAFNYLYTQDDKKAEEDRKKDSEKKSFMNCVDSIIDALDMEPDMAEFVHYKVVHNRVKTDSQRKLELLEPTIFSRGFSYIGLRDSTNRQLQTHMYYTEYDMTPELILRHMCETTKVIGLSATGDIDSPASNFSLQYLKDVGVHFHDFNEEEIEGVKDRIKANNEGYYEGKSKLNVVELDRFETYSRSAWERVTGDEDLSDQIFSYLEIDSEEGNKVYGLRYINAFSVIESFVKHQDIQSMIAFFTPHVKDSKESRFNTKNLEYLLKKIANRNNISINVWWNGDVEKIINEKSGRPSISIIQINGSNYSVMKDEVISRLSEGKKVLVITAYKTLGAGQNLQYKLPESNEPDEFVWIRDGMNDYEMLDGRKDFDAIYLDDPRSVAPLIEYGDKSSLDDYLFYNESMDAIGQIEINEKKKQTEVAFRQCYTQDSNVSVSHYRNSEAYLLAKAQIIIQAVGRMCRTGWKRKNSYIFYDSEISYSGTFALEKPCYGRFHSYEFERLYEEAHKHGEAKSKFTPELIINNALRSSHSIVGMLDDLRYAVYGGDETAIIKWRDIRDFVLANPTCSLEMPDLAGIEKTIHRYGYVKPPSEMDSYHFTLKNDFDSLGTDDLEISFDGIPAKLNRKDLNKTWYSVSPETAKLDLMCRIPYVKEYLRSLGIPLSFEPNQKLMSPPIFRNIYMGGLGELVGSRIIEEMTGIRLREMPHHLYEQFDYMLVDGVFVDFKDWNENYYEDELATKRLINHISRKLNKCDGRIVYVINIVTNGSRKFNPVIRYPTEDGKEIIAVPYLYEVGKKGMEANETFFSTIREGYL
ncbi:MAG: hypothetical protein E7Z70_01675 [Thermoplasmata archaeon]|nr:hypothetical protein [Thermoplasmata archaeon]